MMCIRKIISYPFLCLLPAVLLSCGHENHAEDADHNHSETLQYDEITLSKTQARTVGLRTEVVRPKDFHGVIEVSGVIQASQADERTVVATADGVVAFPGTKNLPGTSVRAGATMATLSSRNLQNGDAILKAQHEYESARREYERAEALVADQIISKRDFEQIRLRYQQAKAATEGISAQTSHGVVTVSAPMTGYVKDCLVRPGDYVSVGQPLFVLTQTSRVQLRADVPEQYSQLLPQISSAHFRTSSRGQVYDLSLLDGRVETYARTLSEGTAYLPITFSLNNQGGILPGSYADVWLLTAPKPHAITVPLQSLIEQQGTHYVYVQKSDTHYRKQEVSLGQSDGVRIEILSGLKPGDKVVTRGAYELRLASASTAIPSHNHEH